MGSAQAAREFGLSPSTLRSWRQRSTGEPTPIVEDYDSVAALRQSAQRLREASAEAFAECQAQVRRGLGSESRNLAASGAVLREQARQLEDDARAEEAHRAAIGKAQADLLAGVLRAAFSVVEVATDGAVADLLAQLLRQAGAGERVAPSPDLAAKARDQARVRLRRELRSGLLNEMRLAEREPQERPALPPASDANATTPSRRPLGAESAPTDPDPPRRSRWADLDRFTHPGLRRGA